MNKIKEIIKKLKILYIENNKDDREKLTEELKKISTNIDTIENAEKVYTKITNEEYNLIICDVNIPKVDIVEFIKNIKKINKSIEIIITSNKDEKAIFDLIQDGISSFLIKPIKFTQLIETVHNKIKNSYFEKQYFIKQNELNTYIDIIESVAVISKTDLDGYITYVDEAFCDVSGYTKEELIGQNHNIVRHPDNPKEIYAKLWSIIQSGEIWSGKVRNIDKDGNPWYAKSTIFPIFDDEHKNIIEYIAIRFLITEEHEEKRELNSKLIKNTINYKKQVANLEEIIKSLEKNNLTYNQSLNEYKIKIDKLSQMKNKLLSQLTEYEASNMNSENNKLSILKKKNDELQSILKTIDKLKNERDKLQERIRELEDKIEVKDTMIESYKQNIVQYKVQLGELNKKKETKPEKKGFFG